jgi:hypothetical protein
MAAIVAARKEGRNCTAAEGMHEIRSR